MSTADATANETMKNSPSPSSFVSIPVVNMAIIAMITENKPPSPIISYVLMNFH